jgi:DNA-binding NarL/FixJ family response regulator
MSEQVVRVLLADDHPAVRDGVRGAIEGRGFCICAEAADAAGAVAAALRDRPDLCLLDINMPGSGIRAAAEITAALPDATVVMLTVSRNDDDLFAALRAGASGYLLKDVDTGRLADALRAVWSGEAVLPRSLLTRIAEFHTRRGRRQLPLLQRRGIELSQREWDVLDRLRAGKGTDEIARELAISPVTVRRHVSSTLKKLRVASRDEALRLIDDGGA